MPEAFAILRDDHRKVERLFEQFEQTGDPDVARQKQIPIASFEGQ